MSNYRRSSISGGTYFFTQVTHHRQQWLCREFSRKALRNAIDRDRQTYPFSIDALVLLPDHLHCIWTLPPEDDDYATRWRLIKTFVTKSCGIELNFSAGVTTSKHKRKERNLWQRRFWEHLICDETDFIQHCDYIHYNPVKHGLCKTPREWEFSSIHRFVAQGIYSEDWGVSNAPDVLIAIAGE
jgi:putative transposase